MEIKIHKCYNPKAKIEENPTQFLQNQFGSMNSVLKYVTEFKPEMLDEYIPHLSSRIKNEIKNIKNKEGFYDFTVEKEFEFLDKYPELRNLTQEFLLAHLNPIMKSETDSDKFQVYGFNHSMAFRRISYHRVKSLAELLGKQEGIDLYTKIITQIIKDAIKKNPPKNETTIPEYHKRVVKIKLKFFVMKDCE